MIILESKGLKINNETVDFTITQPSSPITKNQKTGDTLDLEKNPNAIIECELNNALKVTSTYACEFETDDNQYNFNAKVVNQVYTSEDAYKVTLQIVGKVVSGGKSTAPTISYDNTTFTVSASGDGELKMYVDGVETVSPHTFDAVGTYVVTATAEQDGKAISDTVTENITIAKTATPTISYDNSTFTVSASGQGTVKMYVDGVETVSPHTFNAVGTYVVTATAIETGKFLSDTATENITIAKTAAPTISYDDSTYTVSASGNGTVTMYVDGVETVSPHTFTQGADDVTYVVTATAIETGKFVSDTATENCLVPAASEPEGTIYTISYNDASGTSFTAADYTIEKDPVVITSRGQYGSVLGYFATAANSSISFEAGGATISNIDFIFNEAEINGTSTLTPDSGTFTNNYLIDQTGNWSGSATSVTMTTSSGGFKYIEIRVTVTIPPLYILGNVNGQSWGPNIGTEMNFDSSQDMYTLTITAPANEAGTFSFSTRLASQGGNDGWAELSGFRYGAHDEIYQVQEGFDSQSLEPSTYGFEIQADTEYNISIDSGLNTIEFEQVMPEEPEE